MKIQFIVCGWWYDTFDGRENVTEFIDQLAYLNSHNEDLNVFWACHKEPTQVIKDNFDWKLYENIGLEWGAYSKGFNDLDLSDDTLVFFIQDDMEVYDWSFINECAKALSSGAAVIGNGFNYPFLLDPSAEARLSYWLKSNDTWKDYVREENKHYFQEPVNCLSIRGSFLASTARHIKQIGGFEYINRPLEKGIKEDGTEFLLIDPYGNTALYLNAYKFMKAFGVERMKWMSNTYRRSKWMTECGRGNIDLPQDKDTPPFNIPANLLL